MIDVYSVILVLLVILSGIVVKSKLTEFNEEIREIRKMIRTSTYTLTLVGDKLEKHSNNIRELKKIIEEHEKRITELGKEIDKLNKDFDSIKDTIDYAKKITSMKLDERYDRLANLYNKVFDDLRELDNRVSTLYNTIDHLKQELVELKKEKRF